MAFYGFESLPADVFGVSLGAWTVLLAEPARERLKDLNAMGSPITLRTRTTLTATVQERSVPYLQRSLG